MRARPMMLTTETRPPVASRPSTQLLQRACCAGKSNEDECDECRGARAGVQGGSALLQRACCAGKSKGSQCDECRGASLARGGAPARAPSHAPAIVHDVVRSPGAPLADAARTAFESRFGHRFGDVRVHTDERAAASARAVHAAAYTVGRHVVFAPGAYAPGTAAGDRLLAHELAHVVQQGDARPAGDLPVSEPGDALEREADDIASDVRPVAASSGAVVARQPAPVLEPTPTPAPRTAPPLRVIEGGLARRVEQSAGRAGWRYFWRAVIRRFSLRAATAAALSLADGPLPIGDLIAIGLALWMIWEMVQLWEVLWEEAHRLERETAPAPAPEPGPQPGPGPVPEPSPREEERRNDCRTMHPEAVACEGFSDIEEVVVDFLMNEGYSYTDLGDCRGIESFDAGVIDACDGAPGERWHCRVNGTPHEVSVFGCLCCNEDGTSGLDWRGPHWSINLSRRGGGRR